MDVPDRAFVTTRCEARGAPLRLFASPRWSHPVGEHTGLPGFTQRRGARARTARGSEREAFPDFSVSRIFTFFDKNRRAPSTRRRFTGAAHPPQAYSKGSRPSERSLPDALRRFPATGEASGLISSPLQTAAGIAPRCRRRRAPRRRGSRRPSARRCPRGRQRRAARSARHGRRRPATAASSWTAPRRSARREDSARSRTSASRSTRAKSASHKKNIPMGHCKNPVPCCLQAASLHGPPGAPTVPRHPSPSPTYAPSPSLPLTPRAQVAVQRQRPRQERHR
jgi:hypothetical protein